MDQGDFQMPLPPVDFDVDWSLWENDWSFALSGGSPLHTDQGLTLAYQNQHRTFAGDGNISCEPPEYQLQCTDLSWMNAGLNVHNAVETRGLPTGPLQSFNEADSLADCFSDIGNLNHTMYPSNESPGRQGIDTAPIGFCGSDNLTTTVAPQGRSGTRPLHSVERKSTSAAKIHGKKRLLCPHPGCKLTFPRKYELERHRTTVHDSNVSTLCSVYGCNRVSKPFPRLDKFYEHVRKYHKGPERFLCILESCRKGPLTHTELVDHLNTQHILWRSTQPNLYDSLNALNLGGTFRKGNSIRLGSDNICPLRFLGCEYSQSPSNNSRTRMIYHLHEYELVQRSQGYEIIVALLGEWIRYGSAACPICRKIIVSSNEFFIGHVGYHTMAERILFAPQLAQAFRPYLTMQELTRYPEGLCIVLEWYRDPEFRARVEESGVLSENSPPLNKTLDLSPH